MATPAVAAKGLIDYLHPQHRQPYPSSRALWMSTSDPKREFAVEVVERLQRAGFCALWAGGCVRDLLMGRMPQDYDVATDARPEAVRNLFGRRHTIAVGESFGVIMVVGTKLSGNVEVATFRTEGPYLDGRRPEAVVFSSPEEDAQRRDFTINGMFYDPIRELVQDYVEGQQDLAAGIVRAIGNPADRMSEDKLRLLRAVRFAATLEFVLEPATAEAVRTMAGEIRIVSAERIAQELKKMLVDRNRGRAMELTCQVGLLREILPELESVTKSPGAGPSAWQVTLKRLDLLTEPSFELAAAALLFDVPNAAESSRDISKRLHLSNQETGTIAWLLQRVDGVRTSQRSSLAELKRLFADPSARALLELVRCDTTARDGDVSPVRHCEEFLRQVSPAELDPAPLISGDDLIAMGLRPGKDFRRILDAVRDAQLNNQISTTEEALQLVKRLLGSDNQSET